MIKIGYHGTNQKIEFFDLEHLGKNQGQSVFPGIYFASSYNEALQWAQLAVQKSGGEPVVYIAECELNNPLDSRTTMFFGSFGQMVQAIREYFPNWFDDQGNLHKWKYDYLREKFSTARGQYNLLVYASEESGIPLIEICQNLGFDSYVSPGEFVVTSPQQILTYEEADHEYTAEELEGGSLPAEEDFEEVYINGIDLSGEHGFVGTQLAAESMASAYETKSNDYIRAARKGRPYKTMPGNRFQRRVHIRMNGGNATWFDIDMNRLFKVGSFAVKVPVLGETSEYACTISFDEWLPKLKEDIAKTGFTQLTVKRSLMEMLRFHDLKTRCTCPDFKYRHAYWATVHNEIEGEGEVRPSDITNPKDDLGKLCKHLIFAMNNKIWGDKESRIIYNYLINLKRTRKAMFDRIVAPKLGLEEQPKEEVVEPPTPSQQPEAQPEEQPGEVTPEEPVENGEIPTEDDQQ